ncbi:hypothetical protein OH76DRAFT_1181753 [Lentinus brumalis]|uniref:Uncharacterized protein n=1 Tax=Lentinus brumalis TaxID=2498619 RepID=A0A371CTW4_9APHY|nr:hypothetical protein OH76DRAFT_1181753 [Polyporus brumalis]
MYQTSGHAAPPKVNLYSAGGQQPTSTAYRDQLTRSPCHSKGSRKACRNGQANAISVMLCCHGGSRVQSRFPRNHGKYHKAPSSASAVNPTRELHRKRHIALSSPHPTASRTRPNLRERRGMSPPILSLWGTRPSGPSSSHDQRGRCSRFAALGGRELPAGPPASRVDSGLRQQSSASWRPGWPGRMSRFHDRAEGSREKLPRASVSPRILGSKNLSMRERDAIAGVGIRAGSVRFGAVPAHPPPPSRERALSVLAASFLRSCSYPHKRRLPLYPCL